MPNVTGKIGHELRGALRITQIGRNCHTRAIRHGSTRGGLAVGDGGGARARAAGPRRALGDGSNSVVLGRRISWSFTTSSEIGPSCAPLPRGRPFLPGRRSPRAAYWRRKRRNVLDVISAATAGWICWKRAQDAPTAHAASTGPRTSQPRGTPRQNGAPPTNPSGERWGTLAKPAGRRI